MTLHEINPFHVFVIGLAIVVPIWAIFLNG
jgi:hypothetical protein